MANNRIMATFSDQTFDIQGEVSDKNLHVIVYDAMQGRTGSMLFAALFVVGIALAVWSLRRYPEIDNRRIFAAVISGLASLSILFRGQASEIWFFTAVLIVAMSSTFLLLAILRPRTQR